MQSKVPVPAKQSRSRPGSSQGSSRSRFQPSSRGPGSSQAVKFPDPATQSEVPSIRAQKHKFQFPDPRRVRSHQGPGSSQAVQGSGPVPVKVQVPAKSRSRIQPSSPRSRFQPSSSVPGFSQDESRSRFQPSCQVPGSTTSPIPSIRLKNISSSSRIQDESDPIDPTSPVQFQSRSSSCPVPVKVKFLSSSSQGQVPVKFPDPRRVRSHRSDSET